MTHIRPNFPHDEQTYCKRRPSVYRGWSGPGGLKWIWDFQFEAQPELITCQRCICGYDRAQLALLANTDLGDEENDE